MRYQKKKKKNLSRTYFNLNPLNSSGQLETKIP